VTIAVVEFGRDLLIERTQAGFERVKAAGRSSGRPESLSPERREKIGLRLD